MNIELILHDLHAVEVRLEQLYRWLADLFAEDPEAAELFQRMSREERSHAEQVEAQIQLVTGDHDSVVDMDHMVSWEEFRDLIGRVDALQSGAVPPSLADALAASIEFEGSGAELYSVRGLVLSHKGHRQLMDRLTEANKKHHARLIEFARSRGKTVRFG
jgi:rubrerythrin